MNQVAEAISDKHVSEDIEVRMIDVSGQMLKVATKSGPEDSPPLLMFNGIGANLELAFPFLDELQGRRAIIFDIPGVGGSPMPALPYRPSTLARMAKDLCEILGHDRVDVSGVSWGGGTLLASTATTDTQKQLSPPPITTARALFCIEPFPLKKSGKPA